MWNEAQQQVNKRAVILVVEIVEVPPDEEMYQRGIRQKWGKGSEAAFKCHATARNPTL
ncbi:hypothetical protein IQ272_12160 [Chroococcidiopsidales cyanobacterium LEGE 13417]|nr:hypothetical protein [Chroococcidiopsidales cyanobacterium LEGE 13417]